MKYKIYVLKDPDTLEIRYVGITTRKLNQRFDGHIREARIGRDYYSSRWIRTLLEKDKRPTIELLEETDNSEREYYWIEKFKKDGVRLTNTVSTGQNQLTEDFRNLISHKRYKDLAGLVKGRLTVINLHSIRPIKWFCKCSCGNEKIISASSLRKKSNTQSCGCLQKETVGKMARNRAIHQKSKSKEYSTRTRIIQQCTNPKNRNYKKYGAKGISVCNRWLESFLNFIEDMGNAPTPRHFLKTKDRDKDFCKENCEWVYK